MSSLSLQPVQSCLVTHLWAVLGWDENQEILQALSTPAAVAAKSLQSCPTLHNPMDCSPPGSSVHGIFQARVLEWGAIAFSRAPLGPSK